MSRKKKRSSYKNKSDLVSDREKKKAKKLKRRHLENEKEKFRKSKEWKEFRSKMAILFNHHDYITGRRLVKGFNVHHLKTEQDSESYQNITNESEFIPLNSYCHKLLHYLFTFYRKDKTVINRLVEILDKMCELIEDQNTIECQEEEKEELIVEGEPEDEFV